MEWEKYWNITEKNILAGTVTMWGDSSHVDILPLGGEVKTGSIAICADTGVGYVYNEEKDEWKLL